MLLSRHHYFLVLYLCKNIMDKMEMTTARGKGWGAKLWWKCQKIPSTGAWGRYVIPVVFKEVYRLYSQQFMGSITLNDWQTGWLMKAWIRSQIDTSQCTARSTLRADIPEIHRTNGDFIFIWQFLFFFGCIKGTHIIDDQVKVKVHVATHTICSAGGVTQWQHVWEPGIHLHENQFRSPE